MAKAKNVSIGDLETQLEFMLEELSEYKDVMEVLYNAKSVKEASDIFLPDA